MSFPEGTEMYHFPSFASHTYVFSEGSPVITPAGFPHSDTPGSKPA